MEPSTSKFGINFLLILAILLIGGSLFVTTTKKPDEQAAVTKPVATKPPVVETSFTSPNNNQATTTSPTATTSENVVATSTVTTSTSTTTLINKKWVWVKTVSADNKLVTPKKVAAFTITLNATGTISGTTDCNTFFGSYKSDTTKLSFGPFGSTRMFCEGSQEGVFLSAMEGVKSYVIDTNKNLILTAGSSTLFFK